MKLGLGTVQFGMDYGVSNRYGRTTENEAARIVTAAAECGIRTIDTAILYGCSEEVLGRVLPQPNEFRIVTKTAHINAQEIDAADADQLEAGFHASLQRLNCTAVYGLLVHNADNLLSEGGEYLIERLHNLKCRGLVQKIGVSVYSSEQVEALVNRFPIDLVQVPVNVLDQRFITDGTLADLKRDGIEVHARSVFLQGLLFMPLTEIPSYFLPIRQRLAEYQGFVAELGLTPQEVALGFLESRDDIDVIVCGVNTRQQLLELCISTRPLREIDFSRFALTDDAMLNPSRWRIS